MVYVHIPDRARGVTRGSKEQGLKVGFSAKRDQICAINTKSGQKCTNILGKNSIILKFRTDLRCQVLDGWLVTQKMIILSSRLL